MAAALPPSAGAQTFKVEKFDIKGDGGTDYVAVEPATGRVFVSRSTHMMGRRCHRPGCWRHPEYAGRARGGVLHEGRSRFHHEQR